MCLCWCTPVYLQNVSKAWISLCVAFCFFIHTTNTKSTFISLAVLHTTMYCVYGEYARNHLVSLIELTQRIQTHRQIRAYTHMHMHRLYVLLYCELYTQAREHCAEENRFQIVQIRFVWIRLFFSPCFVMSARKLLSIWMMFFVCCCRCYCCCRWCTLFISFRTTIISRATIRFIHLYIPFSYTVNKLTTKGKKREWNWWLPSRVCVLDFLCALFISSTHTHRFHLAGL